MSKKKSASVDPSTIDWALRSAKRHADELAFRGMAPWMKGRKEARVLSLPADKWVWEQHMSSLFFGTEFSFVGVESHPDVFVDMSNKAYSARLAGEKYTCPDAPQTVDQYLAGDWVQSGSVPFNIIYLDWMGTWSRQKEKTIKNVFEIDALAPDSMLRITISLARGRKSTWKDKLPMGDAGLHLVDIRGGGGDLPDWKINGVPGYIIELAKFYERKAKLVSAQAYLSYDLQKMLGVSEAAFMFRVK